MMAKTPGLDRKGIRLREIPLDLGRTDAFADHRRRIAYERLLADLIEGNSTCSSGARGRGAVAVDDGIRAALGSAEVKPEPYAAVPSAPRRLTTLPPVTVSPGTTDGSQPIRGVV